MQHNFSEGLSNGCLHYFNFFVQQFAFACIKQLFRSADTTIWYVRLLKSRMSTLCMSFDRLSKHRFHISSVSNRLAPICLRLRPQRECIGPVWHHLVLLVSRVSELRTVHLQPNKTFDNIEWLAKHVNCQDLLKVIPYVLM